MDKFKVGDKVRIINCVEPYSEEFNDYIGKTAIITKVNNFSTYDIDIDKGENNWYNSELELADKPKEYTIHNLINDFPEETIFEYMKRKYKIHYGNLFVEDSTCGWIETIYKLKPILDMKFTKVEEPKLPKLRSMTFEEAVRTGKKIKYESEIQRNFEPVNKIIEIITKYSPSWIVKEIFLGTWFAEGVYE